MFRGQFLHKISKTGRISVPSKFRENLKKKHKTKINDNVFIGSNSSLIAPLTIDSDSVVGAGSVITKNVRKKSLALSRNLQTEVKNYKRKKK